MCLVAQQLEQQLELFAFLLAFWWRDDVTSGRSPSEEGVLSQKLPVNLFWLLFGLTEQGPSCLLESKLAAGAGLLQGTMKSSLGSGSHDNPPSLGPPISFPKPPTGIVLKQQQQKT